MMDIEYLARATFKLGQIIAKSKSDDFSFSDDFLFTDDTDECANQFDEQGVGLVYRLDSDGQTFCVRGVVSANILKTLESLRANQNDEVKGRLKIDDFYYEDVKYFKTDDLEQAKTIYKKIINRRFPVFEEILCNLSDPGFSWWMDESPQRLTVYFKSHGIDRAEDLLKLGPIGDSSVARKIFNSAYEVFGLLFPVSEFSCTNKGISIATSDATSQSFQMLKSILIDGENTFTTDYPFVDLKGVQIYQYFNELALMRRFWIDVERHLQDDSDTVLMQ